MIFVLLPHPSRTAAAALPILVFSVFRPLSANIRKEPRGPRLARLLFYNLPRILSKFLEILDFVAPYTRELTHCELDHDSTSGGGGCASLWPLAPLLFGVSFSTGQPRSFRSASSTACARKKKKIGLKRFLNKKLSHENPTRILHPDGSHENGAKECSV